MQYISVSRSHNITTTQRTVVFFVSPVCCVVGDPHFVFLAATTEHVVVEEDDDVSCTRAHLIGHTCRLAVPQVTLWVTSLCQHPVVLTWCWERLTGVWHSPDTGYRPHRGDSRLGTVGIIGRVIDQGAPWKLQQKIWHCADDGSTAVLVPRKCHSGPGTLQVPGRLLVWCPRYATTDLGPHDRPRTLWA